MSGERAPCITRDGGESWPSIVLYYQISLQIYIRTHLNCCELALPTSSFETCSGDVDATPTKRSNFTTTDLTPLLLPTKQCSTSTITPR